jgi:AraC-like DNA-binding protein
MYATFAFAITMLGVFSIFENIKGNQKFSVLKYYMLLTIICFTTASFFDFLNFSGYSIPYYKEISRVTGAVLILNMLYLIVLKKVPKFIIYLEIIYVIFFIVEILLGFQFPEIIAQKIVFNLTIAHNIFFAISAFIVLSSFVYLAIQLYKKRDNQNLYDAKVNHWVSWLLFLLLSLAIFQSTLVILNLLHIIAFYVDSIILLFYIRIALLFFILFRPRFLDDDSIAVSFNDLFLNKSAISFEDFEFLFYKNHYYLNIEANLDDFALKLNHSKEEVLQFVSSQLDQSFAELLNQNRVEYLKQLLRSKKYESFTIEALSEMSGFGSRRSMYNYFNKYVGMTPSEFINSIN